MAFFNKMRDKTTLLEFEKALKYVKNDKKVPKRDKKNLEYY
jgi:hypothetical protein